VVFNIKSIREKLLLVAVLLLFIVPVYATEQIPDILYYQNLKMNLLTGWGYPSPLQAYYSQKHIDYPFEELSTANYRGHVAVWSIENNKLFLKEIQINENRYEPKKFNVKPKDDQLKDKVFADWFSGVVECYPRNQKYGSPKTVYFHIRNGNILSSQTLSDRDIERAYRFSKKDQSDKKFMAKYAMFKRNENYIAYYFRLDGDEKIKYGDKDGFLRNKLEFSPILAYYSNDHRKWPYNWENTKKCGAPNCKWIIEDHKLYLVEVNLHSGLNFYSIDTTKIDLESIFNNKVENNRVFANWLSGIYIIQYGKEVANQDNPEYKFFKVNENVFIRINKGMVEEIYTVLGDVNFKIDQEANKFRQNKIINDYMNQ
jgi:hypothetical protein